MATKIAVCPCCCSSAAFASRLLEITDALRTEELRFADEHALAIDLADHAAAGCRLKIGDSRQLHAAIFCAVHDRGGQGMLAVLFDGRSDGEQFLFSDVVGRNNSR